MQNIRLISKTYLPVFNIHIHLWTSIARKHLCICFFSSRRVPLVKFWRNVEFSRFLSERTLQEKIQSPVDSGRRDATRLINTAATMMKIRKRNCSTTTSYLLIVSWFVPRGSLSRHASFLRRRARRCSTFSTTTRLLSSGSNWDARSSDSSAQQVSSNFRSTASTMKRKTTARHYFTPG